MDANSDTIAVSAAAGDGVTPYSLEVTLQSVRPPARFVYGPLDFQCNASASGPDVFAGPLPAPAPNGSVALYHVNSLAAGDTSLFNESMRLQGLGGLVGAFTDPLDGRVFGLGASGAAGFGGEGPRLLRVAPGRLISAAPAPAFQVQLTVRVDPAAGGDAARWLAQLAVDMADGQSPSARAAASAAWWGAFWGRSYVLLPPEPPAPPRVGVFPCGGASAGAQAVTMDPVSGNLTLPGGLCFVPSAGGTQVTAGPCTPEGGYALVPCTAAGCGGGEFWVANAAGALVLGLPGATCPWCDVWTKDDPTGALKNELFYYNASDRSLRALCANCPAQCVTVVPPSSTAGAGVPSVLASQYARTRYVQATQSRGVDVPIKFNGMLYTTQAGADGPSDVDYRQWGPDHWWQNTRLPYGAMMIAGDFDSMAVVLDWVTSFVPLARARSQALLGVDSISFTETVNAFGLYQVLPGWVFVSGIERRPLCVILCVFVCVRVCVCVFVCVFCGRRATHVPVTVSSHHAQRRSAISC